MAPWFEEGERLEQELQALAALGVEVKEDSEARKAGLLRLELRMPSGREWPEGMKMRADFPDGYPYFRPEVTAPDLNVGRHNHPFANNLCLLGRSTFEWDVDWTLARLLDEQLPRVLRQAELPPDELAADPNEQAEPFSDYYNYSMPWSVLLPDDCEIPEEVASGRVVLGHNGQWGARPTLAVLTVRTDDRAELWSADDWLESRFPNRLGFRWVRLGKPPGFAGPSDAMGWVKQRFPELIPPPNEWAPIGRHRVHLMGFVFPEEVRPGHHLDAWLFVALAKRPDGKVQVLVLRTHRYGAGVIGDRAPELSFMRQRTVALVGAGCIGAPIALELARSGVGQLRMLDHDWVDAATTQRWPVGLGATGNLKVEELTSLIERDYPMVDAEAIVWKIGSPQTNLSGPREWDVLEEELSGCDLIIDATAEVGIHHYLADWVGVRSTPYMTVSGTPGGWGGQLMRIRPNKTEGCWTCLQYHLHVDKTLTLPPEAAGSAGMVQPRGCADPTFTGASFDLGTVSLAGARLAVATLSEFHDGGYPSSSWDYCSIFLRDDEGSFMTPRFETGQIERHPECSSKIHRG